VGGVDGVVRVVRLITLSLPTIVQRNRNNHKEYSILRNIPIPFTRIGIGFSNIPILFNRSRIAFLNILYLQNIKEYENAGASELKSIVYSSFANITFPE
jgi:hypothetical protein